ncbi:GatB/YqeY domain-containing protein [Phanerochaete sordida]|uniref:Altered inheritance of mitochondria protein 41 n=1 Tax=Phanerochaete sordida TaxID=48140 RepID=A0A9P3GIU7_9APHY|nr:GatB/YqeY domain-containing protein [Phanerochaete sordida]
MKAKDTFKSTTIRSVLAEVYSADKLQAEPLPAGGVVSVLRKAVTRRVDAAAEFDKAARADLAEKERREADVLQAFVPPLLGADAVDAVLRDVITELAPPPGDKRALGQVFKAFYARVDRSAVDGDLVKSRAAALLAA